MFSVAVFNWKIIPFSGDSSPVRKKKVLKKTRTVIPESDSSESNEASQSLLHDVEETKPFIGTVTVPDVITIPDSDEEDVKPPVRKFPQKYHHTDVIEISDWNVYKCLLLQIIKKLLKHCLLFPCGLS